MSVFAESYSDWQLYREGRIPELSERYLGKNCGLCVHWSATEETSYYYGFSLGTCARRGEQGLPEIMGCVFFRPRDE